MDPVARPGSEAPDFELLDLGGVPHRRTGTLGAILVVNFWSMDCPHSIRADEHLGELRRQWGDGVAVWSVAANPQESLEALARAAAERRVQPLLLDPDQAVVDLYGAQATPHLFVIDAAGIVRYAGAPDDVTFGRPQATRSYLGEAVAALLAGAAPSLAETPAFGCAITRIAGRGRGLSPS
jgi:peroxiredoxin